MLEVYSTNHGRRKLLGGDQICAMGGLKVNSTGEHACTIKLIPYMIDECTELELQYMAQIIASRMQMLGQEQF